MSSNDSCFMPNYFIVRTRMIQYALYGLSGGAAFVFNVLIVASIFKFPALRSKKNYCVIAALSLSDSIFGFGHLVGSCYRLTMFGTGLAYCPIPRVWCLLAPQTWLWRLGNVIAPLMLLVVSVDRYFAVVHPFKFISAAYERKIYRILASVYGFGFIFLSVHCIYPILTNDTPVAAYCSTNAVLYQHLYSAELLLAGSVTSLSCFVYVIVAISLHKHNRVVAQADDRAVVRMQKEKRITVTLGISSIITFAFVSLPMCLGYLLKSGVLKQHLPLASQFSSYASILVQLNAVANFFIYGLRQKEMKTALDALLRGKHLPDDLKSWHVYAINTSRRNTLKL